MKTLFFGAGPLGSLYAHLLHKAGMDITVLARNERYQFLHENGLKLVEEFSQKESGSKVRVIDQIGNEKFDLVVVLIRRNKLAPVLDLLAAHESQFQHILFMGNNVRGFKDYLDKLPERKILFGFPGAGGSIFDQVVHYVDREKPQGKRLPLTIGEMDGVKIPRTSLIMWHFESGGVPVHWTHDIDGWLKYHAAFVLPIGLALYRHDCKAHEVAKDADTIRDMIRTCKELGNVVWALGYHHRQPWKFNLFYWLPEKITVRMFQKFFDSRFAEIAFSLHAQSARDEMEELAQQFQALINQTGLTTPYFDKMREELAPEVMV